MIRALDEKTLRAFVSENDPLVVWVGILGDPFTFKEVYRGAWLAMRYPASYKGTPGFSARMEDGTTITRGCWVPETPTLKMARKAAEAVPYWAPVVPTIRMIYEMRARARHQKEVEYA